MTNKKFKEVYHEAMTEIYKASIPSASWDDLIRDSPKNEAGRVEIPYWDYHVSDLILDEIIEAVAKKHRLSESDTGSLRTSIYLGPSPISIRPVRGSGQNLEIHIP
jgi:hypothetical protein